MRSRFASTRPLAPPCDKPCRTCSAGVPCGADAGNTAGARSAPSVDATHVAPMPGSCEGTSRGVRDGNLGPIGTLSAAEGAYGEGVFLLTGVMEHIGPSGQARLELALEDATGRINGIVWPEARPFVSYPAVLPAPVVAHGTVEHFNDRPELKVQSLAMLAVGEIASATALLPHARCPEAAWPALEQLACLEYALPAPLDGFLRQVLLDPQITLPFLTCRASVAHHHAFPGGLLVHSTDRLRPPVRYG